MSGLGLQGPTPAVKAAAGNSVVGRFSLRKILPIDKARIKGKLIPWAMKGGLAILDQGVFAGSNFVISILLARWMAPEQYGSYAVAFAVFLFMVNFHQALMMEPMLVFGSSAYRNCLRGYLKALLFVHLGMSAVMVVLMGLSAGIAFHLGQANGLPGALIGVGLAVPSVLLFWLIKRTFYLNFSPAPSAAAAVLYCILTMGGLAEVYRHGLLSPLTALLLMAFGSLVGSAVLLGYLGFRLPSGEDAPGLVEIWRRHWRYGRWALGANAMMWIPINMFYPLVSRFGGLSQAAELKALMNFAAPMLQACAALHSVMLPYSARVLGERGVAGVSVVLRRMTLLCVGCALPYWVVLLLLRGPAFRALYSGRYTEVAYLLPVVALVSLFGSAFFGPSIVLRSMESPRLVFGAVTVSSCIAVAAGIPLTRMLGVTGAVWSMVLSEALAFAAAVFFVRREARKSVEAAANLFVLSPSK